MKQSHLWRLLLIIFVVAWSAVEMYPPKSKDLLQHFQDRAVNTDTNFQAIVAKAKALNEKAPLRAFGNLRDAAGDQMITNYFPFVNVSREVGASNSTVAVLAYLQKECAGKIKLGLDLRGGTSFLVGVDTNFLYQTTSTNTDASFRSDEERTIAISQAIEVLRRRVDKFGVAEPIIQPSGSDRIVVQIPGLSQAERDGAERQIKRAAFLEFRLVHPESAEMLQQEIIPPGYVILKENTTRNGKEVSAPYLVAKRSVMTGEYIKEARFDRDPLSGKPQIAFSLTMEGTAKFAQITEENVGRQLAIVLDGELQSAPVIQTAITGGRGQITGTFSEKEAAELAAVLENPLKTPLTIIESREVDPSLGKDSVDSGFRASLFGVIFVAAFMLVYYLVAGFVANVALLLNVIILFGVMCSFGTTLTLPGIAGIALTIGMAVDANVLIFERIREELAAGKSLRGAVSAGYDKAFSTILDSNVTTVIASVILIYLGTGPIKGFGVTLTIGIAASMFTALVVTRVIFDFMVHFNLVKGLPMLQFFKRPSFNYMKLAKPAFIISWTVIIIGLAYGLLRKESIYGVDFRGGDSLTLAFNQTQKVEVDKIRASLENAKISEILPQYQKDIVANREVLSVIVPYTNGPIAEKILLQAFPQAEFKVVGRDIVGPTVGSEIKKSAIIAVVLAMLGILVYVAMRYEFSFALGAIVALVHDVSITVAVFLLYGGQLNASVVAAILTIIGFSINDTIVIFDRIREDLKLGVRGTFPEIMNTALNQTLSRTVITSGTVFLATLALFLFGGGPIKDFSFCFLVGILVGTYSTIYIAGSVVLWLSKGERPTLASNVLVESSAAGAPPPKPKAA